MGSAVVRWNTMLSFSPLLAKTSRAESVFWPGCSALKLNHSMIEETLGILRGRVPGLGFSSWCCGKPAFAVGSAGEGEKRKRQLVACFKANNIRTIYTLCPNCQKTLADVFTGEIIPAWPLLAAYARENPLGKTHFTEQYILHDPCAGRQDAMSQNAARDILAARGVRYEEFDQCREKTRCCGRKDMLFLTNPKAAARMLEDRLAKAEGRTIISYCESCVEAFLSGGASSVHLLEILLNRPSGRSFINRRINAKKGAY